MRALSILPLILLATLAACPGESGRGQTYTVRGQVLQLPGPQDPGALTIDHEAIDGWVDRQGKVVGMYPMAMPFPFAKDVSLDGIRAGDKIEFTLRVDWQAETRQVEIVGLRKLPPNTELDFRAPDPARAQAKPEAKH